MLKIITINLACLIECYDQLCQMLLSCHAVLIKIHVFCLDLNGYNLQFIEEMSVYYGEAGIRIERCREDCYDLGSLQAAGEQLSPKFLRCRINLTRV